MKNNPHTDTKDIVEEFEEMFGVDEDLSPNVSTGTWRVYQADRDGKEIKDFLLKAINQATTKERVRIEGLIKNANISKDKIGSFKDGHDCLKKQLLYALNPK